MLIHFHSPSSYLYQKLQQLLQQDPGDTNPPPLAMTHRHPGPVKPRHGVPTGEWPVVLRRVVENQEPLRQVAEAPTPLVLTPEMVDALRAALAQVTVSEEPKTPQALPEPLDEQRASTAQETILACDHKQKTNEGKTGQEEGNNHERVKAYLATHPKATDREIAAGLTISVSTANKWRKRIQAAGGRAQAQ